MKKIDTTVLKRKILLTSFFLIILIFSLFKTKLIFYVLPSLPFLVMFASTHLVQLDENHWKKFTLFLYSYFALLFTAAFVTILIHKIELELPYFLLLLFGLLFSICGIKNTSWFYKNFYTLLINTLALIILFYLCNEIKRVTHQLSKTNRFFYKFIKIKKRLYLQLSAPFDVFLYR